MGERLSKWDSTFDSPFLLSIVLFKNQTFPFLFGVAFSTPAKNWGVARTIFRPPPPSKRSRVSGKLPSGKFPF